MNNKALTVPQLAEALSVSVSTVYNWTGAKPRLIPCMPLSKVPGSSVRFDLDKVLAWLEGESAPETAPAEAPEPETLKLLIGLMG